ncbi:MAG: ATP-binding protein [Myxococcales bacterium]|nr:ATP-binding protein [Myxococcales bacterium]
MWIHREIRPVLEAEAGKRPVVLVTGARQSGKTSLLEMAFPDHGYVTLDEPLEAEQAEQSGTEFLERHPPPVIIDELQYAPQLLRTLKRAVDRNRDRSGQYLLTGSQKFALMEGVSESLAGRVSILELHSLSLREIERDRGPLDRRAAVLDALWRGGYPEVYARDLVPSRFYSDYVATYLERDVRQALNVRSLRDFNRFLRLCATRSGQLLNMNGLAGDVGVSPNTIRAWLSVLEASNVVLLLPPYFRNLGKRLVKSPKLYFLDTGLLCHLLGMRSPDAVAESAMLGALFETLVAGQLVRAFANRGLRPDLYFYRDHHGNEVDFVVPVGGRAHLIECKWAETASLGRGPAAIAAAFGQDSVLSRTCITPSKVSTRTASGLERLGPVDFNWLLPDDPTT